MDAQAEASIFLIFNFGDELELESDYKSVRISKSTSAHSAVDLKRSPK